VNLHTFGATAQLDLASKLKTHYDEKKKEALQHRLRHYLKSAPAYASREVMAEHRAGADSKPSCRGVEQDLMKHLAY